MTSQTICSDQRAGPVPENTSALITGMRSENYSGKLLILAPILLLAALDLFSLPRNHFEEEDSTLFILNVTNRENLFHPNHLFFGAVNRLHYNAWTVFGYSGNATIPMQSISVVASLVSVYLVYRIALRIGIPVLLSLACAGWSVFAFGFWAYGLEACTYLLPMPFMLSSVLCLLGIRQCDFQASGRRKIWRFVALGVLSATATALHQQYVGLILVVVFVLILTWRQTPHRTISALTTKVMVYLATAGFLLGAAYLAVGFWVVGQHSVFGTISWARGWAAHGMWEPLSPTTPLLMGVGVFRSIFGVNFLLYPPMLADKIIKAFPGRDIIERRYLAENTYGSLGFIIITGATLTAIAILAFFFIQIFRSRHERGPQVPLSPPWIFTRFAVVYLLTYASLIFFWEPDNPQFWVALTPVLMILLASRLTAQRRVTYAGFILVFALFVANFLGAILPYSSPSTDYWAMQNKGFVGLAGKGDLIVTHCTYRCRNALELETGAKVLDSFSDDVHELTAMLIPSAHGRVFVSSWGLDPDTMPADVSRERFTTARELQKMLQTVRDRFVLAGHSGAQSIWKVRTGPDS
jgi:hypothetical protein